MCNCIWHKSRQSTAPPWQGTIWSIALSGSCLQIRCRCSRSCCCTLPGSGIVLVLEVGWDVCTSYHTPLHQSQLRWRDFRSSWRKMKGPRSCLVVSARPWCAGALCLSRHLRFCGNLVMVPRDLNHPSRWYSSVRHHLTIFWRFHLVWAQRCSLPFIDAWWQKNRRGVLWWFVWVHWRFVLWKRTCRMTVLFWILVALRQKINFVLGDVPWCTPSRRVVLWTVDTGLITWWRFRGEGR